MPVSPVPPPLQPGPTETASEGPRILLFSLLVLFVVFVFSFVFESLQFEYEFLFAGVLHLWLKCWMWWWGPARWTIM